MDICIRADGGSTIGMGHIMRTLVLGKKLKEKHKIFYACRVDNPLSDKYSLGIEKVKSEGFEVFKLNEDSFKKDILKVKADCIITDSYDVDEDYFDIVKNAFKISGCLDDEKICNYFNVDFLINQNTYALSLDYKVNFNTELMLGTEYVILRDEFRNLKEKNIEKNIKKIMVTVGGSDNNNLTENIIKSLKEINDVILYIVIGPAFKYVENLKKYEGKNLKLCFKANMSYLMQKCDLAITSCGSTLYEVCASGIPTLGIIVAENQRLAAESMDKLGVISYSSIEDLYKNIINFSFDDRVKMNKIMTRIVDGKGIERIVDKIEKIGDKL
ncbi:UDP-2,4-diacetamido-2,4,6-trideoxy-beta-L-altropyranose hydrolase [Clostridium cavendishii DSM 21758]|uniref:UDP-2,4-diacetamido-2,4,6-trideoxy-beta-L-altropyranose hydrolase n=1 Tax=Clostridium cavendishii DSM 21758 TaxID=1121302 RepID=A0A1M6AWM3_9CLOT|nr:UDP-2,4-diacetamido-2,4,6-trideoxy-beta-L-altropyranose hydrolase [Clostridium cavendishii]SHI40885.1 UDP-2,4-diacetamido-2,4,6-trideoxy-beta-L-altropyranose hydrolase [Clostridium cavendishii DSM 21758]